jgi:hypothetical protein
VVAFGVQWRWGTNFFDGMQKKIAPDRFMQIATICLTERRSTGHHATVSSLGIPLHIGRGDKSAGRLVRRMVLIDVD